MISAGVGAWIGWALDGLLGAGIGVALGGASGWVLSDAILWLNDGHFGRILRGALIGVVILGVVGIIGLIWLDGGLLILLVLLLWLGAIWGAVVFADLRAALKWAATGAAFGPAASLLILISVARLGTAYPPYPGRLLTIYGIAVLVAVTTFASAILTVTGRLFVGNLVQAALVLGLGLEKKRQ